MLALAERRHSKPCLHKRHASHRHLSHGELSNAGTMIADMPDVSFCDTASEHSATARRSMPWLGKSYALEHRRPARRPVAGSRGRHNQGVPAFGLETLRSDWVSRGRATGRDAMFGVDLTILLRRLWRGKRGASLTEYTILLGLIAVGVIALVVLVAGWMGGVWSNLHSILNP